MLISQQTLQKKSLFQGLAHLHVSNLVYDSLVCFCIQLGVFLAMRQQLYEVQHEVSMPAHRGGRKLSLPGITLDFCIKHQADKSAD